MAQKFSELTLPTAVLASFAASLFAVNIAMGAVFTMVTGTPGASGLLTGLSTGFFLALSALYIPRWGAVTTVFTVYCIAAWPTVLMGPPGWYKIIVGFCAGALYDLAAKFLPRGIKLYIGWIFFTFVLLGGVWFFFELLDLPGLAAFKKAVWLLFGIFTIEGIATTFLANRLFKRHLVDQAIAKRLDAMLSDKPAEQF
jgi:hypothetical protein